jgi:protein-S-isoprenylcysteine O-methyltransferase Ste14
VRLSTAALGVAFGVTLFVALPAACVALNAMLALPVLEFPGSRAAGGILMIAGIASAVTCSRLFRTIGHGTPIPIEPARELIASGPYRFSRHPIYVADVVILLGLGLHRGELLLFAYTAVCALALHSWVVSHEEPVLKQRFGARYDVYCAAVPRWIGRGRPRGSTRSRLAKDPDDD